MSDKFGWGSLTGLTIIKKKVEEKPKLKEVLEKIKITVKK